jgi:hypothetical protein
LVTAQVLSPIALVLGFPALAFLVRLFDLLRMIVVVGKRCVDLSKSEWHGEDTQHLFRRLALVEELDDIQDTDARVVDAGPPPEHPRIVCDVSVTRLCRRSHDLSILAPSGSSGAWKPCPHSPSNTRRKTGDCRSKGSWAT